MSTLIIKPQIRTKTASMIKVSSKHLNAKSGQNSINNYQGKFCTPSYRKEDEEIAKELQNGNKPNA